MEHKLQTSYTFLTNKVTHIIYNYERRLEFRLYISMFSHE